VRDAHTHASGRNALSDLGTEALVEGDVAFFKDAVEKLQVRSATATSLMRLRGSWKCTHDGIQLRGPLDWHRGDKAEYLPDYQHTDG
jgi:hypothetical protein